ncbi:MAG: TetR/AcrR family transcriptional regulator [Hyphomonadaceae bacterium]|nr:TetR/AcrR family transcriptional regulator [Hyphomonadaceae bacterium]
MSGRSPRVATGKRLPGRPRDESRGERILDVTLKLLAKRGYSALTVAEVAARARTSLATIYRRWATKEALAIAAFDRLPELETPDRGDVLEELLDLVEQWANMMANTELASVLPSLIGEASLNPVLGKALRKVIERRRQPNLMILQRAIERGELPKDIDLELAYEVIYAPLLQRTLTRQPLDREAFRKIYTVILAGFCRRPARTRRERAPAVTRGLVRKHD